MALTHPRNDPLWDVINIAAFVLPCTELPKAEVGRKLDSRSAPGSDGGTLVDKGRDLATVALSVRLWTEEHFRLWDALVQQILPRPGRTRDAIGVEHPALRQLGITSIVVEKIGSVEYEGRGLFKASIKAMEYRPPPPRNVTRRPASAGANAGFATTTAFDVPSSGGATDNTATRTPAPGIAPAPVPPSPRAGNARP